MSPTRPVPSSPARRRPPLLALGALLLLGAGAWSLWRVLGDAGEAARVDGARPATGPTAELGGRSTGRLEGGDPFADPGPLPASAVRAGLASRLVVRRLETLKAVVARGADDPAVLADVEAALAAEDRVERIWARGAAMRIAGDRRFLLELAREAAEAPAFRDLADVVRATDPVAGDALLRAVAEAHARAAANARTLDGLDDAIARLAADPKGGATSVAAALGTTPPDELVAWGKIAAGLRPVPAPALSTLVARWRRGGPDERRAVERLLAVGDADLSTAGPDVDAFVAERLEGAGAAEAFLWGGVVRRLPALSEELRARLVAVARADAVAAQNVLAVLAALGPRARDAARDVLPVVSALPDEARAFAAPALAALESDDVLPYAAERILRGTPEESVAWVDALRPAARPDAVVDALAELVGRPDEATAARAAAAVVRVSGRAPTPATAAAIGRALDDRRAPVRAAALAALDGAARLDDATLRRLAGAVDDADPTARAAAVRAASGVWRLGTDARLLAPTLLRLARDAAAAEAVPDVRARAARSLAAVAPDDPDVRAALRAFATDGSPDVRAAGVWGLSRLPSPTPEEKAAVAAMKDDARLGALVAATLARPGWASVK